IEKNSDNMWTLAETRGLNRGAGGNPRMDNRWVVQVHFGYRCSVRGEDGRKLWVLKDGTRLGKDEGYEYDELPCTIYHFERQMVGDWGLPLSAYVHEVLRRQNEMAQDQDQKQINSPQRIIQGPKETLDKIGGKSRAQMEIESGNPMTDVRVTELDSRDQGALALIELY